ncbi:MAG: hypothetical protein MRERC_1c093 [Mycoplasmataceae bacterium RC_NB112A]|nr:MAG: hypothetical protein MRERC_1c093 [Mycoplasmataceae bacterium RC_NB112A]
MVDQKANVHYELLLVLNEKEKNKPKYEKLLQELTSQVKVEKVEEKDWKTVYTIKQTTNISYCLITFFSSPSILSSLINKVLKTYPKEFLNRYLLINLDREKRKSIPEPKLKSENNNILSKPNVK